MRYLLAFFFFFMYMGDNLGLNISLGPGLSSKNLLLYLILTGIAINAAVARNRDFELPSVIVPFAMLIFYALITWIVVAFILVYPNYSIRQSFIVLKSSHVDQFLTFLIFFFGLLHLKESLWLLRTIVWIVVVGNVITIIDTFNIPNLGILDVPRKAGRFDGFLGQPNSYGQFLALFIPASIALYLLESGKGRVFAGVGAFASILALVLSGSRGSYVGLLAGSAFAAFFLRQFIPARAVVRSAGLALVVCAVIVSITFVTGYADVYVERVLNLDGSAHVITHGRTTIWSTAIKAMLETPSSFLTGYGIFSYESSRFAKASHNTYLSYLYNFGAIGLVLYLAVFGRIIATARLAIAKASGQCRYHLFALVFGLIAFLVAIFFSEYHSSGYLLWAYLGVGMRIALRVQPAAQHSGADISDKLAVQTPPLRNGSVAMSRHYTGQRHL